MGEFGVPLKFDRVLCDVPCSGDGTMRKSPNLWKEWTPQSGYVLYWIELDGMGLYCMSCTS
jgi:16S rRNA C967 or C1407 C5-methylase (RsmB/RsmF family)